MRAFSETSSDDEPYTQAAATGASRPQVPVVVVYSSDEEQEQRANNGNSDDDDDEVVIVSTSSHARTRRRVSDRFDLNPDDFEPVVRERPTTFDAALVKDHRVPLAKAPTERWDPTLYQPITDPVEEEEDDEQQQRLPIAGPSTRSQVSTSSSWESSWEFQGLYNTATVSGQETKSVARDVSFFPFAVYQGLELLQDVFAHVCGAEVILGRVDDGGNHKRKSSFTVLAKASVQELVKLDADRTIKEELLTCAWSVEIASWPFVPRLAVAGRGRMIDVFVVTCRGDQVRLIHERSIPGHGAPITQLKFSSTHPHLLVSASEDGTVRLWDPTVPWGSHAAVMRCLPSSATKGGPRPIVKGELLAVVGEPSARDGAHAVQSMDIHPTLNHLVVATGGYVKMYRIDPVLLGPPFPSPDSPHLYQHLPPTHSFPPVQHIRWPFFSSSIIHPGQWPDQVLWASPATLHVISKAQKGVEKELVEGEKTQHFSREVLLWEPTNYSLHDSSASNRPLPSGKKGLRVLRNPQLVPPGALTFTDASIQPSPYAHFSVDRRINLPERNVLRDKLAFHLPDPLSLAADYTPAFLVAPTTTSTLAPNLSTFLPFDCSPVLANPDLHQSSAHPSVIEEQRQRAERNRPADRQRPEEDFVPRWDASQVDQLPEVMQGEHFRAMAIGGGSENYKWLVGVGDGGLVAWWRRTEVAVPVDIEVLVLD